MTDVNDGDKKVCDGEGRKGEEQRALLKLVSSVASFPSEWMLEAAVLLFK